MPADFSAYRRLRVAVLAATWNPVIIPAGARNALISMEDETATWRVNAVGTDPLTAGHFIAATNFYGFEDEQSAAITVFVNPSAGTTAIVTYTAQL